MGDTGSETLQSTLNLIVLEQFEAIDPLRGYGNVRRLGQASDSSFSMKQGRLEQRERVKSEWGASGTGFCSISWIGLKRTAAETGKLARVASIMTQFLIRSN
jgi:hypothetical protein